MLASLYHISCIFSIMISHVTRSLLTSGLKTVSFPYIISKCTDLNSDLLCQIFRAPSQCQKSMLIFLHYGPAKWETIPENEENRCENNDQQRRFTNHVFISCTAGRNSAVCHDEFQRAFVRIRQPLGRQSGV